VMSPAQQTVSALQCQPEYWRLFNFVKHLYYLCVWLLSHPRSPSLPRSQNSPSPGSPRQRRVSQQVQVQRAAAPRHPRGGARQHQRTAQGLLALSQVRRLLLQRRRRRSPAHLRAQSPRCPSHAPSPQVCAWSPSKCMLCMGVGVEGSAQQHRRTDMLGLQLLSRASHHTHLPHLHVSLPCRGAPAKHRSSHQGQVGEPRVQSQGHWWHPRACGEEVWD
jgi:hypothetical protein